MPLMVALGGRLVDSLARWRKAPLDTPVQWVLVASPEAQRADLILTTGEDDPAPMSVPRVSWPRPPDVSQLDEALQEALRAAYGFVVGHHESMALVCRWIRVMSHPTGSALNIRGLILGSTGTGKELVARAVHQLGPRRSSPFVALNCASLPRDTAPSELFGHVRGAYTGAHEPRRGALMTAANGVLFLDEVGDLPFGLQGLLLRALEQRTYTPMGADTVIPLEAQIVSATNLDLAAQIEKGQFRADLYFRLAQLTVELPILDARRADLGVLARGMWVDAGMSGHPPDALLRYLNARSWPGNIRELRSVVESAALQFATVGSFVLPPSAPILKDESNRTLAQRKEGFEREVLAGVLKKVGGDTTAAARELGVTRRTIYNLLRRHGLGSS